MNIRLVGILLLTIAFQQSQSKPHKYQHQNKPEKSTHYDDRSDDPFMGSGGKISTACQYGTTVIEGNIMCQGRGQRVPKKYRKQYRQYYQ
ncbi:unnamed protein product [Allacma fusca]|uniref:Uncharacterized protein n=1 Tax=Allacma fusca TaxID=39272 RepID=A0A8J2M2S2_9HEXA|nr:unnamed protein product [Allacma fusca]